MIENPMPSLPHAPAAAQRNAGPILGVLRRVLPAGGTVLEIAAGSGYHSAVFARAFPHVSWQPTDPDPGALARIADNAVAADAPNLRTPLILDASAPSSWPVKAADAVVCINMIHISPWTATQGLFAGAAAALPAGGVVATYGPYILDGDFLAESNVTFDQSLRARNPDWGLREVRDVEALAKANGFALGETVHMPANNLMLVFRKAA